MSDARAPRRPSWLPLAIGGTSIVLFALTLVIAFVDRNRQIGSFATAWSTSGVLEVLTNTGVPALGILIASKRPANPIGWLFLTAGATLAIGLFGAEYAAHAIEVTAGAWPFANAAAWLSNATWPIAIAMLVFLLLLFPTGVTLSRRWRVVAIIDVAAMGLLLLLAGIVSTAIWSQPLVDTGLPGDLTGLARIAGNALGAIALVAFPTLLVAALVSVILRFRRSRGDERLQMKWFTFASALVVLTFIINFNGDNFIFQIVNNIAFGGLWVAIAIAMLKYRLYDIDLVIRKTLVGGVLLAFVTAIYGVVVAGIGILGSQSDLLRSGPLIAIATAVIAIAFQPMLRRARHVANRLVYGDRATPYEVLSEFSERMGETFATREIPERMARILAEGTGATTSCVWLSVGGELRPAAVWPADALTPPAVRIPFGENVGVPGAGPTFPVRHQGDLLGVLSVDMPANEPLGVEQERLCVDLASQAGLVLRNVLLIEELRASRQRLVAAQDEERRKLERNIHDGAQQQLVALAVRIRMAKQLARRDVDGAEALLEALGAEAAEALETLRDLARGIYPPLLADQGLPAALEAQGRKSAVPVRVDAGEIGRYPQEAEAAVYFCVLEALQNVAKYADASAATVHLAQSNGALVFEVSDDGCGFDPETVGYGTGLQGIADRLAALDGSLDIRSEPGRGTLVTGRVPATPIAASPASN